MHDSAKTCWNEYYMGSPINLLRMAKSASLAVSVNWKKYFTKVLLCVTRSQSISTKR